MRFPLAACTVAALTCLLASQSPAAQTDVPAVPDALGQASAPPAAADAPPPFVVRPKRAPQPPRPDLTFASRPAPADFRGLSWGTPLDKAQASLGLTPVKEPRPLPGTFQRPDELLRLGLAEIRTVAYYFPKGLFSGAGIVFAGEANFFLIKDHLIESFGPGRQVGDRYGWTWQDLNIDLRMNNGVGELRYTYEPQSRP